MQDDITDGVKYLIDQGIADPDKGLHHGRLLRRLRDPGRMTFTPELYACGVNIVGSPT
jgi:hypothetical protein